MNELILIFAKNEPSMKKLLINKYKIKPIFILYARIFLYNFFSITFICFFYIKIKKEILNLITNLLFFLI